MSPRLLAASFLLTTAPALAQSIPVETFTLPNGMTVILREDHALPVATINLWYRVGAKEEPPHRSGFAHLFEHLMFMGTERVPGNEFDKIMESGGGSNNASTSLDRTNYFSTGPRELLPTLLWLDADRMEDLGRSMTQEKLDKQRDVVRNERRQVVENAPYGKADDALYQLMYPAGHPYHFAVIGTHNDLEAAQVYDVKDFFGTFYIPNNCSMVIAGDFNSAEMKPVVTQLFGTLPRGAQVQNRTLASVPQPKLPAVIRRTMLDKIEQPRVTFCYHSPAWYADGDAELDLLSAVLTQGKSSRLYKRLVLDDKLAVDVSATQDSAVLGSLYRIDVYAAAGADLDAIEKAMDEEIGRILQSAPTSEELDQRKTTIELAFLARMDSLARVADKLNEYQYIWGEPNSFKRDLDRYRNATPAGVQSWASRVLTPDARVILRVLPEQPERAESPRDAHHESAATKSFTPPAPRELALEGGVKALLWSRSEVPLVTMRLVIQPGGALVPADKAGLASLAAQMLEEGSGALDAVAFADTLQRLGATFSAAADQETITLDMTVLKRNFPAAAKLFVDAVRTPTFSATDFERVHRLHLEELQSQLNEPAIVATRAASRVLFGDTHPYAMSTAGTPTSVRALTLDQVKSFYAATLSPKNAMLYVSGDVSPDETQAHLGSIFAGWAAPASVAARQPVAISPIPAPSTSGLRVFLVHRPDAVQTVIRFAAPGPKFADAQRVPFRIINTVLGGSFTSRLNQNLREDHGYTYGAGSAFSMEPSIGWWSARASVRADVTGASLAEFFKEFDKIRSGDLTDADVAKAVKTLRTDTIDSLAGIHGPVQVASELTAASLSLETISGDLEAAMTLRASDLNPQILSAINLKHGVLVLVGDATQIRPQLEGLNLPVPIILNPDGTPATDAEQAEATKGP